MNAPTSETAEPIFSDSANDGWTSWMRAVYIGALIGPMPMNGCPNATMRLSRR